jgi:two-component system, NarL family, nitrate/nitrite response regulator NarL
MTPPRVLLADDHFPIRVSVRQLLEEKGFEVCAEATDAASAVEAARREGPDICLLEVALHGDGLTAAAAISERVPEAAVVMLTASADDSDLFTAIRCGASGYLLKDMDPERLAVALRGVLEGEAAIPPKLVARLLEDYRRRDRPRRLRIDGCDATELTERETEVVALMREGSSTSEIAERLSVSPVTVRRHISEVRRKLGVSDRASALRLVAKHATDSASAS